METGQRAFDLDSAELIQNNVGKERVRETALSAARILPDDEREIVLLGTANKKGDGENKR
jgi:hypothetical protein